MARMTLTLALERYDRHVPFFMGTVTPPEGVELKPLEVGMVPPRRDGMGPDLWPAGFAANRDNLERFIGYCHDQGLIPEPVSAESLFDDSVLDT